MNKIDPRELRRLDVEKAPLNDNYEENEINFDFSRFFKLSFRHKKIILISFVFFYPLSLFLYVNKSVIYEKVGLFTVNSASNNSFFRYLDQSVGFESGRGRDEVEAYASKALANLGSDDFLNFCYREALKDPEIAKIFGLRLQDKSSSELNHNSKEKLNLFFKTKIQIVPLPPPKIRETARNAGFMLIAKDYDLKFLEYAPEIIEKLIKSYLVSVDVMTSESAKELVKQKVEELQKKINENNERKIKLSQEIPLVDKSTLYNLQAQLQATQITISGNKALEEQFKDSLANVEKKLVL